MVLEGLFKKREEEKPKPADSELEMRRLKEEREELELRSLFYKRIIDKYAVMINEYEEKTVPELKSLVNRNDSAIIALKRGFVEELLEEKIKRGGSAGYVFAEDFLFIADKIFEYCRGLRHIHANLSVSFWLPMKEVAELKAADPFDRTILLCSLLRSLDAPSKIRVLELENNLIHPVVITEFVGKLFVLDPSQPDSGVTTYSGAGLDPVLSAFQYDGNKYLKSAYEFNDEEYTEF